MRFLKVTAVPLAVLLLVGAPSAGQADPPQLQSLTTADAEAVIPQGAPPLEEAPALGTALLAAALSQEGIIQDCTDLVQNSLAAIGLTTRRDAGGFDYGVDDVAYTFGYEVHWSEALPGDIATVGPGNGGHVWIVLDPASNLGVHGGWENMTVVGNGGVPQNPLSGEAGGFVFLGRFPKSVDLVGPEPAPMIPESRDYYGHLKIAEFFDREQRRSVLRYIY